MRWRTRLAVLPGLLLLLPLAWSLHTSMLGGLRPAPGATLVPMLSPGERQSLMSYERPCSDREDCEPPRACFFNKRSMWRYCTDSRCLTDQDCAEDMVCRTMETGRGGPRLRQCTLVGMRKEGEPCSDMSSLREASCERGLQCQNHRCGRPCQVEKPESCPEGFFCREGLDGPSCLPTCEGRACPEGQDCIQPDFEEGVSVCAQVHGQNCQQTPCPEGFICRMTYCRKSCDPAVPNACGPHYKCHRDSEQHAWTCEPDM